MELDPYLSLDAWEHAGKPRGTVVFPDTGSLDGLLAEGRLDRLPTAGVRLVVVDAAYDALPDDHALKAFIDANRPPFTVEETEVGALERKGRHQGREPKGNAVKLAVADFMSSDDGLRRYVRGGDPVAVVADEASFRVFNKPANLYVVRVRPLRGPTPTASALPSPKGK